ncbi:hypothetical protein COU74_04575 [Candidatus Peregrinibacteria bacterium CG10_big_fil_rev_8_21_14_0_10_36_19]|nr:MAG: hypothetical protein COU74_04575 [Candidatus Peregrinibacteria bacterium CG10_big_fil_rev_8_21_14_0_10_36_19]
MQNSSKLVAIKELLEAAETSLKSAKKMLNDLNGGSLPQTDKGGDFSSISDGLSEHTKEGDDTIVEGVFNGQFMTDKHGKEYPVPANYASKSKLVPGDVLKLTIKPDGTFLYKQIGPTDRLRIIGTLTFEDGQYKVIASGKAYKVLLASVTYFKGEVGDKVTIIIPAAQNSEWSAIENILPKDSEEYEISEY